MIGKVVKINNPAVLTFFYPSFKVKSELTFTDRDQDIIYNGPMKRGLTEYLKANTRRFICTTGVPELDFNNREAVLKWLFAKVGKEPTVDLIELAKNYDEDYFIHCVKVFWLVGRWIGQKENTEVTLYDLFTSTTESVRKELEIYFTLLETMPAPVVESSFLTFLSRIKNISEQSAKPGYMKLLKQCDSKFGNKIKPAVYKFAMRDGLRDELLFIDLATDLR